MKCAACGHVYQSPRPTQTEIGAYYPATYKEYTAPIDDDRAAFMRWNRQYGMWKRCRVLTARRRPGRLLDVGCGTGLFLNAMRRHGWEVAGEEMTPVAVRIAREKLGLNVFEGTLEQAAYPDAHFDAVTLWNVIEHVPDPSGTIREIARIVKPGGLVVLSTPNVEAYDARIFGRYWASWEAPRHFNIFSAKSLGRLLRRHGFGGARSRCVVGTWFCWITSLQYLWEERTGFRPDPASPNRAYWDSSLLAQALRLLVLPYTWLSDRVGAGSTMVITAERQAAAPAGKESDRTAAQAL